MNKRGRMTTVVMCLIVVTLCLSLSTTSFAIITGNPVTVQEQEDKGLVAIGASTSPTPFCSGVLLANDWVLTAGHCIANNRDPFVVAAFAEWGTAQNRRRTSDAVYQFGGIVDATGRFILDPNGEDLALVHLSAPFSVHGTTTGFPNRLNTNLPASVQSVTVASYGIGYNTLGSFTPTPLCMTGAGVWRAADLTISTVSNNTYSVVTNGAGQILAQGDSGGPDFIFENGVPKITGIHSSNDASASATAACDSFTSITRASSTSIPATHPWISAVLRSQWHPTTISEPVWTYRDEMRFTGWDFADVNQTHWAHAMRASTAMCYDRGFAGGHFDGHQDVAAGGYGIQCSSKGVIWRDVTAAEIAATGWGFTDVNTVSWARANRAAERLCAGLVPQFAGGHLNGHMRDGQYGLFCYRDGARWFDAADNELAATGWGLAVDNLDAALWAQAARTATDFCRTKGFSGGFLNGQHVPGRSGVVCQGATPTATPLPSLVTNFTSAAPGSVIMLSGTHFPANSRQIVKVNGGVSFAVSSDTSGSFKILLDTTGAGAGNYNLATSSELSSNAVLTLHQNAATFEQEAAGPVIDLSTGRVVPPAPPSPPPQPSPSPSPSAAPGGRMQRTLIPFAQK